MRTFITQLGRYFVIVITILVLAACPVAEVNRSDIQLPESEGYASLSDIPFTELEVLEGVQDSSDKIIPWDLARTLAYIQFRAQDAETHNWEQATLSERPVLVYDANSTPQFYEFIVHTENGEALGTITTYAQEHSTSVISHILPYVRDYSSLKTKGGSYSQVVSLYPNNMLLGVPGKSGEEIGVLVNSVTGEAEEPVQFASVEDIAQEIQTMTAEEVYEEYGVEYSEFKQYLDEFQRSQEASDNEVAEYWATMKGNISSVEGFAFPSDEEIDAEFQSTKWIQRNRRHKTYRGLVTGRHTPRAGQTWDQLYEEIYDKTRWDGYCLPSATAYAYFLFYSNYKNYSLRFGYYKTPLDSNNNFITDLGVLNSASLDGGLYSDIAKLGKMYSNGGVNVHNLDHIVKNITSNRNRVFYQFLIDIRGEMHKYIYNNRKPVFYTGTFTGANSRSDGDHIILLIGTRKDVVTFETQFLFWWIPGEEFRRQQFLVHDNGYVTGTPLRVGVNSKPDLIHNDINNPHSTPHRGFTYPPFWVDYNTLLSHTVILPLIHYWQ